MNPMIRRGKPTKAIIIGGGFYGCSVALMVKELGLEPVILEASGNLLGRASAINQARIHGGYHYPRSLMTAIRSRSNYHRFRKEYESCVVDRFTKVYAVGRTFSKVSASQFALFMRRIGAPLKTAPEKIRTLFDARLVEDAWIAEESAFDWTKLRDIREKQLCDAGIPVHFHTLAKRLERGADGMWTVTSDDGKSFEGEWVFNCSYSMLNGLRSSAGLPLIPLKHELAEMALIRPPDALGDVSVTMMCGPFFSFMPYPSRGLTTLSHVRYTPHLSWQDMPGDSWTDAYKRFSQLKKESSAKLMLADAVRYIPALRESVIEDSLWEVKTVLPQSESDDGRPILFHRSADATGLLSIMGGKIDNIFDVSDELTKMLA